MNPNPDRRLAAAVLAASLLLFGAAAMMRLPLGASAQVSPWQPVLGGLYGDHVVRVVFVGETGSFARSLMFLPQGAGLYRYAPEMGEWQPVAADPERPAAVVRALVVAPSDTSGNLVYAGLEGRTLLARSDDAGFSFRALAGPSGARRLDLLAVTKSGYIYATESGSTTVWTSTDGGESWESRPGPPPGLPIQALFAAPDDPTVYALSGDRLYRVDAAPGGWAEVLGPSTVPALTVAVAAAGPRGRLYAAGRMGGVPLLRASEDRGSTWLGAGWPEGGVGGPTALEAGEEGTGLPVAWLGLEGGQVLQVSEAGAAWEVLGQLPLAVTALAGDATTGERWAGSGGLGLYRLGESPSQTGAVPLTALALAAPSYDRDQRLLLNVEVLPERRIGPGAPLLPPLRALYESVGGHTWSRRYLTSVLGTNLLASPDFQNDRRLYSGQYVSYDGGAAWRTVGEEPGLGVPHVVSVGPLTGTMPVVYALRTPYVNGVGGAGLLLSEDGGFRWRDADVVVDRIVDVVASPRFQVDRRAWFVTDSGAVYRAEDGYTFSAVSQIPSMARQRIVYDLAMSPDFAFDNTLFVAVEDPSLAQRAHVYVNTNAGAGTWRDRSRGLPTRSRPRRIVLSPNFRGDGVMFLGAENRVGDDPLPVLLGTNSAGEDWFGEQVLPPSIVHDFVWLGPLRGGRLFAAAGRAGLWVRALDGPPHALATNTPTATATPTGGMPSSTPTSTAIETPSTGDTPTPGTAEPNDTPSASPSAAVSATGTAASATPTETRTSGSATVTATRGATATRTRSPDTEGRTVYLPFAWRPRR